MSLTMPRPVIKCSKCGSTNIAIPERDANGPDVDDGGALLRCRACGHEKIAGHKQRFTDVFTAGVGTRTEPTEETF